MLKNRLPRLQAPAEKDGKGGGAAERDPKAFGDEVDPIQAEEVELDEDGNPIESVEAAEEEELEEELDDKGEKGEKAGKDGKPIPGKRAAEMVSKAEQRARNAMQAQLDELKAELERATRGGKQQPTALQQLRLMEAKKAELEEQYEELMTAGKKDELPPVRREMKRLESLIVDYKVELRAMAAQTGAAEDVRYKVELDKVEERYPELNPEHEDYDKDSDDEVSDLVDGLVAKGVARDVALKRAVKYVLGERKGPKKDGVEEPDSRVARAVAARKKAAAAASRTPANGEGVGRPDGKEDNNKLDISKKITPETFARFGKMDEKDRSRLRGDTL